MLHQVWTVQYIDSQTGQGPGSADKCWMKKVPELMMRSVSGQKLLGCHWLLGQLLSLVPTGSHWFPLAESCCHWLSLDEISCHFLPLDEICCHWLPLDAIC